MAPLADRERHEAALARTLGKVLRAQFKAVMEALGESPSTARLTSEVFDNMQAALRAAVRPILVDIYLAQVEALMHQPIPVKQGGIGIEWTLVNERAQAWASAYSLDLTANIVGTTRKALLQEVADRFSQQIGGFFAEPKTLSDLQRSLEPLFGPVRAEMIAVTEVTRAASQGEQAFAEELRGMGLKTVHIWQTANDDLTCPICAPLHGTRQGDGWTDPPPAHPRCRCWINTVVDRG